VMKGDDNPNAPFLGTGRQVKASNETAMLYHVGTHPLKSLLYHSLKLTLEGPDPMTGLWRTGAQHFPINCDQTFFEQLTAESLKEIEDKYGRMKLQWVKPSGARNEQMDLWVYARAVAEGMEQGGLSSWSYPGHVWSAIMEEFGAKPEGAQLDLASHWQGIGAAGQPDAPAQVEEPAGKRGKMKFRGRD